MKKNASTVEIDNDSDERRTRAKRPVYFIGLPAGTKPEIVQQDGENWSQKEAEEKIKAKLGANCVIIGPHYKVKGVKTDSSSMTVKVDLRQLAFTADKFSGDHGGWT